MGKNAKSTKHRKTREFLALPTLLRQGARPLSPTERRELPYGYATARGPLAGFMRLTPDSRAPAKADPAARAGVVVVGVGVGVVVVGVVVVVVVVVVVAVVVVFGHRFAPVLALGCGCGCCCCGCRCRPCFLLLWLFLLLLLVLLVLLLLLLVLLLLLADVGPIWAQFCPCLGPRLAHVAHILA